MPPPSSPAKAAASCPVPAASTVQQGSRVRIAGLQAKPQHNGRTGIVCGEFNHESGRWAVEVDASVAGPAFRLAILPANLTLLPSADLGQPLSPAINLDALLRRGDTSGSPSAPSTPVSVCTSPAKVLQQGSRVRIEGLWAAPQHNGRTGVISSAFNQNMGLWTVEIDANTAGPAFRISTPPSNLTLLPP